MTSSLIMSFWQIFWESFILTYFFVFFYLFLFLSMILVWKKELYQLFSFLQILFFYVIYLNTNKLIYNNVWLLNTIFTNKLQFYLVLFTYKLFAFRTFSFKLIVHLLPFSLVRFLTNNSFHTFQESTRCWDEILTLGKGRCLVDSKNIPYFIDYSYL